MEKPGTTGLAAGTLFGKFPRKPKAGAQKIKDEMRKGWM